MISQGPISNAKVVEGIMNFRIPPEQEDYVVPEDPSAIDIDPQLTGTDNNHQSGLKLKSNLRLFPPPLFSRQNIPQNYKYVKIAYSSGLLLNRI